MDDTEKEAGVHSTFESRLQRSFFRNRGRHQNTPVGNSPGQSSIFRFVRIGSVSLNLVVFAILTFPPSGSWEGDIRLWKLDSKLKSFSLVGTMPALGVVNSLQFVSPPKSFFDAAAWTKEGQRWRDKAEGCRSVLANRWYGSGAQVRTLAECHRGLESRFGCRTFASDIVITLLYSGIKTCSMS